MAEEEKSFNLGSRLVLPLTVVGVMLLIKILEVGEGIKYTKWGIFPRDIDGLIGIFTAPFIHGDWQHLFSNSLPMLMLLVVMTFFYKRVAIPAYLVITVFTGFTVWLFGRQVYHVGASGVVYGLVAFVAWTGIFRRNLKSIILSLIILVVYSSYFNGIVPNREGVSWESHLFGGLVGIFTAFLFKDVKESDETERPDPWKDDVSEEQNLFAPDTFLYTKQERYQRALEAQRREEEE